MSLAPLLREASNFENATMDARPWALSQYPRCPPAGADPKDYYKNNKCEFVERSTIPIMGYSLRVDAWRLTLWARWNGSALRPKWDDLVGTELYEHEKGGGQAGTACDTQVNGCFDNFENADVAKANPEVVAHLAAQLKAIVAAEA